MTTFRHGRAALAASLCLLAPAVPSLAFAADDASALRIESVVVIDDLNALAIAGRNFPSARRDLVVRLGATSEPGDITALCQPVLPLKRAIACTFPGGLPPDGDYLLGIGDNRSGKSFDFALTIGAVGPRGPAGPADPAGETGDVGPAGPRGDTGDAGPQGAPGEAGPTGAPGLVGPAGADGPQGPRGETGATGAPGSIGPQGDVGAIGPQGAAGPNGAVGPQGESGPGGPVGPRGIPGPTGAIGPRGTTGETGAAGATGSAGATGQAGPPGPPGVTGPAGDTGPQGTAGTDGAPGAQGAQGIAGPVGPTCPAGPQGAPGNQGQQGIPGPAVSDARFGNNTSYATSGRAPGSECVIGTVHLSAGGVAPDMPASGQILSISSNSALYSLLGTTYGGDGVTTFRLPDLRAAAPNGLTYWICTWGLFPFRD